MDPTLLITAISALFVAGLAGLGWFIRVHLPEDIARIERMESKFDERIAVILKEKNETIKSLEAVLMENTRVLGTVVVLFTLVENDLKNAAKRSRPAA